MPLAGCPKEVLSPWCGARMPSYDQSSAECRVFTYKEGLLSAVAHDLEIDVTKFSIEVSDDGAEVQATFDARSLRVLDAVVSGRRAPGTLSDRDKRKIESNIVSDVLQAKRHPEVRFTSNEVSETAVSGRLELHGRSREIWLRRQGDTVTFRLHQPDFGIKPYTAMLGMLKIKPEIEVRLTLKR